MATLYGALLRLSKRNIELPRIHYCCGFASLTKTNNTPQLLFQSNKKITHLIRTGRLSEARALFDSMKHRNTVTWNSMISGYVHRREIAKARQLFDEMPHKDIVSWNLIISGYFSCRGSRFVDEGRKLFDLMPQRDCVSWNTVISGYAKNGGMDQALKLFRTMPERNVVSSNAVITGFLLNGDVDSAVGFFKTMPEHDSASLSALISGLVRNDELNMAARILLECGNQDDGKDDLVQAYNTLIAGFGQRGKVEEAQCLFDAIPNDQGDGNEGQRRFRRNVVSWNSMMMCYVKAGDIVSARELFDRMMERDTCSWNTMISGYVQISDMDEASKLFRKMPSPDALSWNSIISGFAQIGNLELARDFFDRMSCKNLISWNSLIAGYEKNEDYKGAITLFSQMQLEGERPDRHTLSSVLSVCTGLVDLYLGKQIHQLVTKTVLPDLPINNSLITMYSRCGAIVDACTVFNEMKLYKDVITWNAMIGGYASHGLAPEALELFKLMKRLKIHPTYITFISVLSACAHAGLVEEGRRQFNSMINDYGIEPRVEHFASLVDILGRQGQLQEAKDLINSMPFKPDKAVWGALLGACRVHNNVELAKIAAEALIRLEPESSAPYVLLYNMYANLGQWDDAERVRVLMEEKKIKKQAGYSWVDSSNCQ
ncbi:pentatricopeptide repeat-containing protein At1g62260, mitochondrial [Gastrolobium bilobum]|uniref:pentatricopeptide repeat-containing protein At1g62260, mitochondrial n=1 Tax=Gastrolobium bilobum TaxID=150636 RepID=UPI002AB121F9|nr:pentatricopeptide repeat-containing protein At1g62260, mitochondrial [Gastrolobium bilobum]